MRNNRIRKKIGGINFASEEAHRGNSKQRNNYYGQEKTDLKGSAYYVVLLYAETEFVLKTEWILQIYLYFLSFSIAEF